MLSRSSKGLALCIGLATALASTAFAPGALAQTTGTAPAKKADPAVKKPDAKPATTPAPATSAAPATAPATPAEDPAAKPAEPTEKMPDDTRAIYISVDLGFTRADVGGISDNTGFDKTAANGLLAGIGLGYRYKDLRIGARFRDSATTEISLWSLMGEVGYGLPFRPVEPVLFAHAGYMFSSGVERSVISSALPPGNVLTPSVQLDGLVVGGEVVASLWVSRFLRVGPFLGVDFSWLHRGQVALPQSIVPLTAQTRNNGLYTDSGSGVGYLLSIGIRGTGDIAF